MSTAVSLDQYTGPVDTCDSKCTLQERDIKNKFSPLSIPLKISTQSHLVSIMPSSYSSLLPVFQMDTNTVKTREKVLLPSKGCSRADKLRPIAFSKPTQSFEGGWKSNLKDFFVTRSGVGLSLLQLFYLQKPFHLKLHKNKQKTHCVSRSTSKIVDKHVLVFLDFYKHVGKIFSSSFLLFIFTSHLDFTF